MFIFGKNLASNGFIFFYVNRIFIIKIPINILYKNGSKFKTLYFLLDKN